jgi:hypothetical protein
LEQNRRGDTPRRSWTGFAVKVRPQCSQVNACLARRPSADPGIRAYGRLFARLSLLDISILALRPSRPGEVTI